MKLLHSLLVVVALSSCISCSSSSGIESNTFEGMGISYMQEGNFAKSKKAFDKALTLNPNDPELLYNSILNLCALDQFSLALEKAQKGYEEYPNYLEFIDIQIKIYTHNEDYPSAIKQAQILMDIKPQDEESTYQYLQLLDDYISYLQDTNMGIIPNYSTLQTLMFIQNTLRTTAQSLLESKTYQAKALALLIHYYPEELQYQIYLFAYDRTTFENLFNKNILTVNDNLSPLEDDTAQTLSSPIKNQEVQQSVLSQDV